MWGCSNILIPPHRPTIRGQSDNDVSGHKKWAKRLAAARRPGTAASESRLAIPLACSSSGIDLIVLVILLIFMFLTRNIFDYRYLSPCFHI